MQLRRFAAAPALVLALLATGCSSMRVSSDWDRTVDFGRYRTYAWAPTRTSEQYRGQYDLLDKRIRRTIDEEMEYKGFQRADRGNADLIVVYRLHTQQRTEVYSSYSYGWGPPGVRAYQYTEGSLQIMIVDAKEDEVVWEGVGTDAMGGGGDPDSKAQRAVIKIMDSFPPTY
jgi:hypothetical protein